MPVTRQEFRRMALSFPETEAKSHMGHPDFRVAGKIFATLGYPDMAWGMVKLTPLEQRMFIEAEPKAFDACSGAWGRRGATGVKLGAVKKTTLRQGWASGTPTDSEDTLRFAELSGVRPMVEKYPLEKANEAYARMISGKAEFRVVLTIG